MYRGYAHSLGLLIFKETTRSTCEGGVLGESKISTNLKTRPTCEGIPFSPLVANGVTIRSPSVGE